MILISNFKRRNLGLLKSEIEIPKSEIKTPFTFHLNNVHLLRFQYEIYLSNVVESTGSFVDLFNAYYRSSFTRSTAAYPA